MSDAITEPPDFRALVGHREFVRGDDPLEVVQARFAASRHDFMAVLDGRHLLGLCARRDLGTLLGARYGFALNARRPVREHLAGDEIRIRVDEKLTGVLQSVSVRQDEHFYDDVLLVDARGDFIGLVPVREIVRLQTSLLLGKLEEIAAKNRQMEDDLRMAREVQVAMLPREFPAGGSLRFAQLYQPAGGVSGDFFDVLPLEPGRAGLIVCDVMGHGVRSALITAMVRTVIEELRPHAGEPGRMLSELNAHLSRLLRRTGDMIFVTAAYAVVDAGQHKLDYAQAGHPAPLLWDARTSLAVSLPGADRIGGPALGLMDDAVYETLSLPVESGDRLLLYTDGIFEVVNDAGEEFGPVRLAAALAQTANVKLADLPKFLLGVAGKFGGGAAFADDVCLLACELGR